jgi:hypothetical protein
MHNLTVLLGILINSCFFLTGVALASERQAALDGGQYTVIAPVYDGSGGALSYIRLFNGGAPPAPST